MAGQGEAKLVGLDAAAIVDHCDAAHAAFLDAHINARGAGIDRVFQQFLDHRRGSLDHFACGDLTHQMVGQCGDHTTQRWRH